MKIYFKLQKSRILFGFFLIIFNCVEVVAQVDTVFWKDFDIKKEAIYDLLYQDLDRALTESEKLLATAKTPIDTTVYTSLLLTQGHILSDKGSYSVANLKYLEAIRLRELLKDKSIVSSGYQSLANMNYYLQEYDVCRQNAYKAIASYQLNSEYYKQIADAYNLIAVSFYDEALYDSAVYYCKKGIVLLNSHVETTPEDYTYLYDNLGNTLRWRGNVKEGLNYLQKSVSIYKLNKNFNNLIWNYEQFVSAYIELEELDSAKHYLNLIDSIPKKAFTLEKTADLYYFKILVATGRREFDSLELYVNQFYTLSDSLVTAKTESNIKDAQTKYETEKKEAALKLSEEEKATLDAENKAKKRLLYLGLAVFVIVILLAIYFYRNFKQKEKLQALEVEVKNAELDELLSSQESEVYASILKGQEQERERIAQDLHDRLGGTLAALKLSLRKPQYKIEEDDLSIIDSAVNEVRSIAHNLSTGLVYKYGLNEAVNQLFRTLENSKGIKFSLYLHPEIGKLGQTMGIELYRIVQELVSNTLKHAKADEVSLQTNFNDGVFNLIYEDNGVGFNPKELKGGIGLENVKGRVERIGGELNIDAEKGRGSIFIVELKNKV